MDVVLVTVGVFIGLGIASGVPEAVDSQRRFLLNDVDYASPLVFDPLFYLNDDWHMKRSGIRTPEQAKSHWLSHGIQEGRQGCGSFHSKQYLARYMDLQNAFHTNYKAAIHHYLTMGHTQEHRFGYLEGGFHTSDGMRWTISNGHGLYISASARMGASIDSLVWNNKEFINAYDHGRELQMACNTDYFTECYNPTEAGGRDDISWDSTKTIIKKVQAHGNLLQTEVLPSYWLRPGDHETGSHSLNGCGKGSRALNTNATYGFPFQKEVTIGCANQSNCIEYISKFTIGGHWPDGFNYIQMEAPTGYLAGDFTQLYSYNPQNHHIGPHHGNRLPVVLATADDKFAMGVYTPAGQDTDAFQYYGSSLFSTLQPFTSKTSKWSVVFRKRRPSHTTTFTYKTYICVGDKNTVSNCLTAVVKTFPHV